MEQVHRRAERCYDGMARGHVNDFSSPQTPFRHFNNFVKKQLIQASLDAARQCGVARVLVLDIASGRGGDLFKWAFMQSPKLSKATAALPPRSVTRVAEYHCFDISSESIASAQDRATTLQSSTSQPSTVSCTFSVANCFDATFLDTLRRHQRHGQFHVVSVQFALHYACESDETVRATLQSYYNALAPGGVFIATIVDASTVLQQADYRTNSLRGAKFTMSSFSPALVNLRREEGDGVVDALPFGTSYHFFLDGFVDCTEYLIPLGAFHRIAESVGFRPDAGKGFAEYLKGYAGDSKALKLDPGDCELVSLYRTVLLTKPNVAVVPPSLPTTPDETHN